MLLTLDLPTELEQQLQIQADLEQLPLSKFVEKIIAQSFLLELTMEEIEQKYANEWVLVEITAFDEHENPSKGIVITHDIEREAITEPTRQLHQQKPGVQSFVFYAGSRIPEGVIVIL